MTEITEKQKMFLIKRNAYVEGMTKEVAHATISELMGPPQEGLYSKKEVDYSRPAVVGSEGPVPTMAAIKEQNLTHSHSPRDASIVAQCLTKIVYGDVGVLDKREDPEKVVLATYKWFLGELSA